MKKNQVKIFVASFIILILVFIGLFIKFQFAKTSDANTPAVIPTSPIGEDNDEHGEDPIDAIVGGSVGGLDFSKPTTLLMSSLKEASPHLVDATDRYALVSTYGGYLHVYDIKGKNREVIDRQIEQSLITPDNQFVIYYTEQILNQGEIKLYDITTKGNSTVLKLEYGEKLTHLDYNEGVVLYSTHPAYQEDKIASKSFVISNYIDKYPPSAQKTTLGEGVTAFAAYQNQIYMYMPNKKSIDRVQLGLGTTVFKDLSKEPIETINKMEFNTDGQWFALYDSTSKTHNAILLNGTTLTGFSDIQDAAWYQNQLLIIDDYNLYVYDEKTKTKTLLKTFVSEIQVFGDSIVYREGDGSFYQITKKAQG